MAEKMVDTDNDKPVLHNPKNIRNVSPTNQKPFPVRLYKLLEEANASGHSNIISWDDDGCSFLVHRPKVFAETLMRSHFNQSKYKR